MAGEEALLGSLFGPALVGIIMGMFVFFLIVFVVSYVYYALALQTIAKKTKVENGWWAWIPILNILLMLKMAKLRLVWALALLLAFIPGVGALVITAGMVYLFWKIAEAVGKPGWLGILTIVPIANFIVVGILAWGK